MSMIYKILAIADDVAGETLADPGSIHEMMSFLSKSPATLSLEKVGTDCTTS